MTLQKGKERAETRERKERFNNRNKKQVKTEGTMKNNKDLHLTCNKCGKEISTDDIYIHQKHNGCVVVTCNEYGCFKGYTK